MKNTFKKQLSIQRLERYNIIFVASQQAHPGQIIQRMILSYLSMNYLPIQVVVRF